MNKKEKAGNSISDLDILEWFYAHDVQWQNSVWEGIASEINDEQELIDYIKENYYEQYREKEEDL